MEPWIHFIAIFLRLAASLFSRRRQPQQKPAIQQVIIVNIQEVKIE